MLLGNQAFGEDIESITEHVDKVVIDEAHVCSQWGGDFRKTYADLGDLRALFPPTVPFLAVSATMTQECQRDVFEKILLYKPDRTFTLNLGNDRLNIMMMCKTMKGSRTNPTDLDFIFKEARKGKLRRRMIFVGSCAETVVISTYLKQRLPEHFKGQVAYYHAQRGTLTKESTMSDFRDGRVNILVTTEAAGMVSHQ
jgi:superfamily II DNA helicase RecQ